MSKMDAFPEVVQMINDEIRRALVAIKALQESSPPCAQSFDEFCQFEISHRETIDVAFSYRLRHPTWRSDEILPPEMLYWRLESAKFLGDVLTSGGFWFDGSPEHLGQWLLIRQWPHIGLARWKERVRTNGLKI